MRFSPVSFYNWLFGSHDDSSFTSSTKEGSAISSVKPWAPSDQKKYDQITKFQLLLIRFFPLAFFFSGCGVRLGVKVGDDTGEADIKDSESSPECIPATEIPYDGMDQDCDGLDLTDVDGDGYDAIIAGGEDCDDENSGIYPGAEEFCNGIDDNCDGNIDEGTLTTYYKDSDGDEYGNTSASKEACFPSDGYVVNDGDCDESNPDVNPGAIENYANEIDDDCDGVIDDEDGDGYTITSGEDCDDTNSSVYPGATEVMDDGVDQDCSGADTMTLTTVNCTEGDYDTIQEGIDAVEDAGTVQVCEGTYLEHLEINKAINIEGVGTVILDGDDEDKYLVEAEESYSIGISFDNISFTRGGAVYISGPIDVSFSNCSFYENSVYSSSLYTVGVTVLGAFKSDHGDPTVTITDSSFFDNECGITSTCVGLEGSALLENVLFENNTSDYAILASQYGSFTLEGVDFISNIPTSSTIYISATFVAQYSAEVTINDSLFEDNLGELASAIYITEDSTVTVENSSFANNLSSLYSGSLDSDFGAVHLNEDGSYDNFFYSINTLWEGNDPYDVTINTDPDTGFYSYTAGSATDFSCRGASGSCD